MMLSFQRQLLCVQRALRLEWRRTFATANDTDEDESYYNRTTRDDADRIRARGMLRRMYSYEAPDDVDEKIQTIVESELPQVAESEDWRKIDLTKNMWLKFQLLTLCERRLSPNYPDDTVAVPNDRLHEMRTVQDVVDFYKNDAPNINEYRQMARNVKKQLPPNLHIVEAPKLFHPDDKHELHGGITAFPGMSRAMKDLRDKRLYRSFRGMRHWYEWSDINYSANVEPKNAPWTPESVKKLDSMEYDKATDVLNFGKPQDQPQYDNKSDLF